MNDDQKRWARRDKERLLLSKNHLEELLSDIENNNLPQKLGAPQKSKAETAAKALIKIIKESTDILDAEISERRKVG